MKNVIVTGGAGYIGSHACKALAKAGYVPVTFDNLVTGWKDAVKYGPFEFGCLSDSVKLDEVFDKYEPIAVMHFAALSQVGESMKCPEFYWSNNTVGSFNLFQSARKAGCDKIVFSSTCATYGDHDNVVIDESIPQNPINPYGKSKRANEEMLQDFDVAYGIQNVIFRYFNVAGSDPDCEIGEQHEPETHLIPLVLESVTGTRNPITIYGSDYDTPDGTCIRDYVHVCDLVDAHVLGLERLLEGKESRVFNLGTGEGFSVKDVISRASSVVSCQVPHVVGPRREGDCAKLVSGSIRAISDLGWAPQHSALSKMIQDAWNWKQHGVRYNK